MKKEWIINNDFIEEQSLIKNLLHARGITSDGDIKDFLNPLEMELSKPEVFNDMEKVVNRLSNAITNNEPVVIYGDFDADGITSTAILYKTLQHLKANVHYFIPDRETQGHGFDTKALIKLMTTIKPKIIISVDCGISDVEAVKFVNSFTNTIDVIITDHHEAPEVLPQAYAIINPKAPYSLNENLSAKEIESLTYLAGCGVAFKVSQALLKYYNKTDFINEILPFVAIGTVADVVPLLKENRYFVKKGLELISSGKHLGIKMLLESAGYDISKGITAENIAFGIAPRINASGRLDNVNTALKVLISDNVSEIQMAITTLNELNQIRQRLCSEVFEQANMMYQKQNNKSSAIILYNDDWHIGIIGIVASKLVEKYYKPVFLMSHNKETNEYRCSARSIEGVPLYDVIKENEELFEGFGGHKLAAGLSFNGDKVTFETVKEALNKSVEEYTKDKNLKPYIKIDLMIEPEDITLDLIEEISSLEPFGASNPSPIFAINDMLVKQKRLMGNDNSHLKLSLTKDIYEFNSVWWGKGDIPLKNGDKIDLAFHPQKNEFNGNTDVQLIIDDIHNEKLEKDNTIQNGYKIYDNRTKIGILNNVNDYLKNTKLNIKVFAESKKITEQLKPYNAISSRIFTRENISKCDVVMLFDYPADKNTFINILNFAQPKGLHFMNYEINFFDETSLLKTFTGMIKYAANNNYGKLELIRCASFLGKSIEVVTKLLDLYEKNKIIEIFDKNSQFFSINCTNIDNFMQLLNTSEYIEIYNLSEECEMFQHSMLEEDLTEFMNEIKE